MEGRGREGRNGDGKGANTVTGGRRRREDGGERDEVGGCIDLGYIYACHIRGLGGT